MWSLEVVREEYDLFNGQKNPKSLFFVQHRYSRVVNKMFRLLADNHAFEGGDRVIYKQNNKVQKQFALCNVCCQEAVKRNQIRCTKCDKTLATLFKPTVKQAAETPKTTVNKNLQYYKY